MAALSKDKKDKKEKSDKYDPRLSVTGTLRSLALIGILGVAVFGIWHYRDEFSDLNIKRVGAYFSMLGSKIGEFESYTFEYGIDTVCKPFSVGLAVASAGTYSFASSMESENDFSLALKYANPVIETSDYTALIYDRGGTGLCIANTYAEIFRTDFSSSIISASINKSGAVAVVTDEAGYRSAVTILSSRQKEIYKWQTPEYYTMTAAVSPKENRLAAYCVKESGGSFKSVVRLVADIKVKDSVFELDLGQKEVYSLKYIDNDNLLLICSDGVYLCDEKGNITVRRAFAELLYFSHHNEDLPLVAVRADSGGIILAVLDYDLETVYEERFDGSLKSVDFKNGRAAALFSSSLVTVDLSNPAKPETKTLSGVAAQKVYIDDEGGFILVYSDRAEKAVFN